ncbi:MAG: division/cell wall cluster transcriptional repressor MraZ [Candidatus Taylorbacteria bacterium]|nr:division/cell wall cluster transcriptional repressor MraZ [Candidatus Taylorbacteria bacterium]
MLIGEHIHTFDEKNRISLPSKFRKEMGAIVVIAPGVDNCLFVFTMKGWNEFSARLTKPDSSSVLQSDNRNFNRLIIGRAAEVEVDSVGRMLVPDHLREYAGLKGKTAIIGVQNRVEIWDADAWVKYRGEFEKKTEMIADKLSSAGVI